MSRSPAIARLWRPRLSVLQWLLWAPLTPLSVLYAGVLGVRARWWRGRARHAPVTTISVGNLTVGGNGKTPFTLFLAEGLSRRGYRVAIVSRGYGRRAGSPPAALVADHGVLMIDAADAGDEPAMMAHAFAGPIAVARRRLDAIGMLVRRGRLDAVILDDAFQHLRLRRDLDLLLIGTPRGIGNGWLLPAGPLREPLGALRRANAVILMARAAGAEPRPTPELDGALAASTLLRATLKPRALIRSADGAWVESALALRGRRVVAVSGLADPGGFSATVRGLGAQLARTLEYPDHHRYSSADWDDIRRAADDAELVLTTEKDLVKLQAFSPALDALYALRVDVVMDEADETRLFAMATACIERRRGDPRSDVITQA